MPRILIVEDEAIIRSALKRLLERHHYSVSEAASAEEASACSPTSIPRPRLAIPKPVRLSISRRDTFQFTFFTR